MHRWFCVIALCIAVLPALGQTPSAGYQPGTIIAVTAHQSSAQHDAAVTQYDVSLRVGNTIYVVLFTPPNGSNTATYTEGDELLVLVEGDTVAFNTPAGKVESPIERREAVSAQNRDTSKTPGQDYAKKLALTDVQQAEITPILAEEAGLADRICANPYLSRMEKVSQYNSAVWMSDEEIKPLLSAEQLKKLHDLRKEQKHDLKQTIAEEKRSGQD
ncbi:MAG: hypothetical protein WBW53_20670 [Terriglobales bacterium]